MLTTEKPAAFDPQQIWAATQLLLQLEFSEHEFRCYIELACVAPVTDGQHDLRLLVPNEAAVDWFQSHALERINQLVGNHIKPGKITVEVSNQPDLFIAAHPTSATPASTAVPDQTLGPPAAVVKTPLAPQLDRKEMGLSLRNNFAGYYNGPCNAIAISAGLKLATKTDAARQMSPLFIHGSVGLGKSHLAHAIGNHFLDHQPHKKVRLLSGEQFMREVQECFRNNRIHNFRERFRLLDLLIIDDIQMIGRESEQTYKQLRALFNYMADRELPIVLTSDRPATLLGRTLPANLISRIRMGVEVTIDVPDLETRIGILYQQAHNLFNIKLCAETARLIATKLRNNCRELVGILRRVYLQAEHLKTSITPAIAQQIITELTAVPCNLTIPEIIEHTARYFNIKATDLLSKRRTKSLVLPRHIAMHLCRELTSVSLPAIAAAFNRHHTSVLHACQKMTTALPQDKQLSYEITRLRLEMGS